MSARELAGILGEGEEEGSTSEDHVVIDIRDAMKYSKGHIPGAIHVPADELSDRVRGGELESLRGSTIYVICATGSAAPQAAVRLNRVFNFESVISIKGGMLTWLAAGHPTQCGA